ncbi:MAG: hypothetical protein DRI69_10835 [Bacteroidetes bacterium]|nr:MAG: hypothetical protein DRI69_10835 [Bacteroidota bacterium]
MKHLIAILWPLFLLTVPATSQSDSKAIEIAEEVMEAMGGEKNWAKTRYLQWNFFGRRLWYWDKKTGDVRCEIEGQGVRIAMNINDKSGNVYAHDMIQTHPDSLDKFLNMGYRMWINDSYWLVMPFKLRDPGTTIKYMGLQPNAEGTNCAILELTFTDVGVTPDNKYLIYVDPESHRVVQWDYFKEYSDSEPAMSTPWTGYQKYDKILLSDGRGKRGLSDIAVHRKLPAELFSDVRVVASTIVEH